MAKRLGSGALVFLLLGSPSWASAPEFVRVSFDDPDTAHQVVVTWNTDSLSDPTYVEYGPTTAYGTEVEGAAFQANGALGVIHEVTIDGLEALSEMHYRVGGPGGWSSDATFRTGPENGCVPFRFVALGDNRGDTGSAPSKHWNPILTEALSHDPAFVINTGDLVKDGDDDQQWHQYLEATGSGVAKVPLMPSMGNHDDDKVEGDAASYNQLFSLPRNDVTGSEDYYYFVYGDAIFVAISTVNFTGGVTNFAEQAAWLDGVLTANPVTWKFVYFHHPIYTGFFDLFGLADLAHPPNEKGQNAAFVPVFDAHHVDIVFNGHNHFYQRFEPMCCGGGADEGVVTGDTATGTTYIITGGAGALTYDLSILGIDVMDLICNVAASVQCDGRHHYVLVDIDGLDLHAQVFTTSSQLTSNQPGNVELIDEFSIHKSGPELDCSPPDPDPGPEPVAEAPVEAMPDAGSGPPDGGSAEQVTDGPTPGPDMAAEAEASGPPPGPDTPVGPSAHTAGPPRAPGSDLIVTTTGVATGTPASSPSGGGCSGAGGPAVPLEAAPLLLLGLAALGRRRAAHMGNSTGFPQG